MKHTLHKILISFIPVFLLTVNSFNSFAQTGPGGVGNADGINGQPKNVLWLDASSLSLTDGADISVWNDLSGNNNNLSQSVSGFTPIFRNNGGNINGHPRAEFSKNNNRIVINPFNDMPTSGITNFVIYKTAAGEGNDGLISYNTASRDNAFLLFNSNNLRMYLNGSVDASGVDFSTGNWLMMSHKWNSSNGNLIYNSNGNQVYSTNFQNGVSIPSGGSLAIGGEQDSPDGGYDAAQDYDGEIAEVIMYNSFLNSAQRIIVENYLSQKYNISFATASNDKFGNDADFNSNYIYNIAGIGQETDGDHTQTSSGGLYLYERNSSLANGEYIMFAHDNTTNNSTTTYTGSDLPANTGASWARQWYIEKTSSDGIDAKLIFDFKEALSDGQYPANVANYVLLYRNAATGAYSLVNVAGQGLNDADQVYFNVSNTNLQNGYYTIGTTDETNSPVEGIAGRTWYALASGDWDTWDYWTLDPSGSLPNNPSLEIPGSIDKVVIHTGKTITISTNSKTVAGITIDGILQLGTTSGHNFTTISGSGRIKLASDNFPLGDASDFVTEGQGEGTVVWQGSSYSLATPHTFFNMEVNLDNVANELTMLADYTINGNLVAENGIFKINDNVSTNNLNLTVKGNVFVENNGQILTGSANARHQFNMYGDLINNGTIKFTNRVAADYANEATDGIVDANFLNNNSNQTILCNGITNFYRIEINKGNDMTYELLISANSNANFKLYGYASQAHSAVAQLSANNNALGLIKGTVRIRNNVDIPHLNRNGNYNISEAARLWVDGGSVSTNVSNAIVVYGEAKITDGTFDALVPQGFTLRENGSVVVEGGILNANQIRTSVLGTGHVGSFIQSGGTANIVNPGNNNANYYHFSMTYPGNVFTMSGGTLHIYDANGSDSNSGGIFIASDPANINVTGGTVIAEIASTTYPFKITSTAPFYNLILRNTNDNTTDHILDAGTNINNTADADLTAQPLVILNDLIIEDNCFLDHNGEDITIGRNFSISENTQQQGTNNYGLLYDASKPNTVTFKGNEDGEFYIGHSTADNYELYIQNIIVDKTVDKSITIMGDTQKTAQYQQDNGNPHYWARLLKIADSLTVEKGILNQGEHSIRLFGPITVKQHGQCGVYIPGTTHLWAMIMLKDADLNIKTEQGAIFGNIKMNPSPNTDIVSFTSNVYIKRLSYFHGRINLKTYNLKIDYLHEELTQNNYDISSGNSSTEMFFSDGNASDGGLSLYIPAGITDGTKFGFPLGVSGKYTPAEFEISNVTDNGYITIRPAQGELQTTNLSGGDLLNYYWRITYSDFSTLPTLTNLNLIYDDADIVGTESQYVAGKVLDENPFTRSYEDDSVPESEYVDAGNNTITFNGQSDAGFVLENANYTAGVTGRFTGSVRIYYSRLWNGWTGNQWSDPTVWSTVSHNSSVNSTNSYPQTGDIARVGYDTNGTNTGSGGDYHSIICDINNIDVAALIFDGDGTTWNPRVYVQETQTHNFHSISGRGGFVERVSPANIPVVNADMGNFVNNTEAYFYYHCRSDGITTLPAHEVYPNLRIEGNTSAGVGNRILIFPVDIEVKRDMKIDGGAIIRTDNDADGNILVDRNFYVGGYRDGAFQFSTDGTERTLTVKGDITIRDGQAQSSNNYISVLNTSPNNLEHKIIIYGNIIQREGTFDLFSDNSGGNNVILEFQAEQNATYTYLAGNTADLYRIIMNKGANQTYSFSFENNFNLNGLTNGAGIKKTIELQNGTLILNNSSINIYINTGNDNFYIPAESCLEVRQGQVKISGDDTGILLDGKLLVSGGTVNMDDPVNNGNNYIEYSASGNAEIVVTAGTLIVGSQIRRSLTSTEGILSYNQSGGTVIVGKNSAPEGNRGIFEILNTGSSFTHSAGSLSIIRQQTNPTIASLYLDPETANLTAGTTITLGNGDTPANQEFGIYSTINIENLTLNNSSANNPKAKMWTIPLTLNGELNIQSGTEFNANGLDLNCYGDFTNAGTFTANGNITYFKSNSNQQINGNTTFWNLTNQNTANLNLAAGTTEITIENILNLENGNLNDNANEIFVYGDINNDAVHNYGGTGVEDGISLVGMSQQTMTGSGTYGKLTVNNGNGIVLPVGNTPTISDYLKLEAGVFNIGGNILTLGINCQIQEANPFGINNMIGTNVSFTDYGVKKYFPSGAGNFIFPVGSVSGATNKYTPAVITITQNSSSTANFTVKPADEIHPTITEDSEAPDPEIVDADNVLQYYWVLKSENFSDFSGTVEYYYDENDVKVTSPYDVYDYITAKLLEDGTGNWYKFDDVSKFDETNKKLIFDYNNGSDIDISGDYTAGVDGSSFLGAIPDQVPLYVSKGIIGGGPYTNLDWHTADTWRIDDGGSWVLPGSIGLPDIPYGARVRIIAGDKVTTAQNYISAYTSDILGTLDVGTTFNNRIGNVSGTGTLYTERGTLPGGFYEEFFSATGGTVEFGGTADYSILSNIFQVNNIIFSGTGKRELPNLNLIVLGNFTINGTDASLKVINEFDQKLDLRKNIVYNNGSFDAGTGTSAIVEFNGTTGNQIISGSGSFTDTNAFNNVIINNTDGITMSAPVDIDNTLSFADGIIHTDAVNILKLTNNSETIVTGAGSGKFIDGPLSKNITSGQSFVYPVGNANRFGQVAVLSPSNSDYWIAQYYNHNPNNDGYDPAVFNSPLQVVSDNEYWRVLGQSGATAKIRLYWNSLSGGFADDAHRSDMRIAEWRNGSPDAWNETDPSNTITGNATTGHITPNNNYTTFNEFTNGNIFTLSTTYTPNNFDWEGDVSTAWENGNNWSGGVTPSALDDINIINANPYEPTISSAAQCNALALANGRTLTVSAGNSLTVNGDFSFNGTLVLKSPAGEGPSASFIDNGTITGTTGTIQAERFLSANKFHYISSPIQTGGNAGSDLFTQVNSSGNFNPNFYYYDESFDLDGNPVTAPAGSFDSDNLVPGWTYAYPDQSTNDPMEVETGYAFWSDENTTVTFIGKPNTGDININNLTYTDNDPVAGTLPNYYDGWNLIANPYPSAINWDIAKAERINLDDGIYVWDGTQYASYAGGIQGGSLNLTNEIAPMQAFFVHATANPGSITLKNSHRVHSSENYLKAPVDENNETIPNFIRLKMEAGGYSDYTVIYFKSNATAGFDSNFDAYKLFSNFTTVPHLYSITENDEIPLSINSLHSNSMQDITVPLIVKIGKAGTYSISLDEFNFENHYVYFIDKYTDVQKELHNETLDNYIFTCDAGTLADRFELHIFENHPPSVEGLIPDMEIPIFEPFSYTFGENVFVDLDFNDKLTYKAALFDESELPDWLNFNPENETFSGTPESIDVLDIKVTATDKLGESASEFFTLSIYDNGNSSLNNISEGIEIYPNPAINYIYIKQSSNSNNFNLVSITDITGKIILETNINSDIFRINVSDFAGGTYFVKVQTSTETLRKKIIIKK